MIYSKDGLHLTKGFKENVLAPSTAACAPATQTIKLGALADRAFCVLPVTLSSSSDATVTNSVSGPATASGLTLTLIKSGTVTVIALQSGNGSYASAAPAYNPFITFRTLSICSSFPIAGQAIISG